MTNWKEQFDKEFKELEIILEDMQMPIYPTLIKYFISTEIIEKLIEDIPDETPLPNFEEYKNDCRAESEWSADYNITAGRNNLIRTLKQQIRDKWL